MLELSGLAPIAFLLPWWSLLFLVPLGAFLLWFFHWPGRSVTVKPIRASKFSPEQVPAQLDHLGGAGRHLAVGPVRGPGAVRAAEDPGGDGPGEERADLPLAHLLGRRRVRPRRHQRRRPLPRILCNQGIQHGSLRLPMVYR